MKGASMFKNGQEKSVQPQTAEMPPVPSRKRAATPAKRAAVKKTSPEVTALSGVAPTLAPQIAQQDAVTHDEVARLAYLLWEARGYQGGSPEVDWHLAESYLRTTTLAKLS
jgi:hypothetical protein